MSTNDYKLGLGWSAESRVPNCNFTVVPKSLPQGQIQGADFDRSANFLLQNITTGHGSLINPTRGGVINDLN